MYVRALATESKETLWLQQFVTVAATDPGEPNPLVLWCRTQLPVTTV